MDNWCWFDLETSRSCPTNPWVIKDGFWNHHTERGSSSGQLSCLDYCQKSQNHRDSHLSQLLGGREGFLVVIRQTILTRTVPTIYLRDSSWEIKELWLLLLLLLCGYMKGEGVFGTFQVFPLVKGTLCTSTDVEWGVSYLYWCGTRWRASSYEDTTYIDNVYE